ncbi:Nucleotidylyl transferase [Coniophora puteana RWD-64-598 SS2]|uniref:Pantoate--beta-alanine ligase n=1 Tax=Coniophora puteana (strain RWD-64-598) TaxID=741705 RepID=A0A5M3MNF6_CONPW|nr:Nucleotidylyl transferase [Coniophora puteana RWD-64-598 SS2]EIW80550.1 Nucleotidylyl transferase [Coniophora puteana RWD-64-598 SS2]
MGALHDGHLSLVRRSLAENDLTVLSIFVNPAQFAPHEDLATYPRTLPRDLELLAQQTFSIGSADGQGQVRTPSAVFLPSVHDMYPTGIVQDVAQQKGTFVEVKGYSHQMEGQSQPTFFRGVATVVTKLFNAVQPTNAYFGQKDIQQGLLLRRMCRDLLLPNPAPERLHICPTARDPSDGLALSSRNAYLSEKERGVAGTLYQALQAAESAWTSGKTKTECVASALDIISTATARAVDEGIEMKLEYVELNDSETFEVLDSASKKDTAGCEAVILSGALRVGKTRLIDNIVIGDLNRTVP